MAGLGVPAADHCQGHQSPFRRSVVASQETTVRHPPPRQTTVTIQTHWNGCQTCQALVAVPTTSPTVNECHILAPLCDIPSGCCSFTGPWTVTHSSLCMLRRVATFCLPLRPVLLLVSFPRSRSPVVGVLGLC